MGMIMISGEHWGMLWDRIQTCKQKRLIEFTCINQLHVIVFQLIWISNVKCKIYCIWKGLKSETHIFKHIKFGFCVGVVI